MRSYLWVIFWGIGGTFLYNYFALAAGHWQLRHAPVVFGVSAVLNIVLDLVFVVVVPWGVAGGRLCHQPFPSGCPGLGLLVFTLVKCPSCAPAARMWLSGPGAGDCPVLPSPACSSR